MLDALKQDIANFFYFSLLNEYPASQAAIKTFSHLTSNKDKFSENLTKSEVVLSCTKNYLKFKNKRYSKAPLIVNGWQIPEHVDRGLWMHFHSDSREEEYLTVIWSLILKYPDSDIAKGLGITEGTVRHRVARALRKLGDLKGGDDE